MTTFYRTSTLWVIDFRFDGRPRRWFKSYGPQAAVIDLASAELHDLFGRRVHDIQVRPASDKEERQYLRGEHAPNPMCPVLRRPPPAAVAKVGAAPRRPVRRRPRRSPLV